MKTHLKLLEQAQDLIHLISIETRKINSCREDIDLWDFPQYIERRKHDLVIFEMAKQRLWERYAGVIKNLADMTVEELLKYENKDN